MPWRGRASGTIYRSPAVRKGARSPTLSHIFLSSSTVLLLLLLLLSLLVHSMKIDNRSIERVEEFKYLGTTLANKNSIQEEIKSRLKVGNACYYSVENLLFSSLLSKC